jgi:hypothetical protein
MFSSFKKSSSLFIDKSVFNKEAINIGIRYKGYAKLSYISIATIIFSIALQKIIRSPILVALTIFAAFLIVTFTAFDESFLIFTILYTILAYISAIITRLAKRIFKRLLCSQNEENDNSNDSEPSNESNCECNNRSDIVLSNNYQTRRYWR